MELIDAIRARRSIRKFKEDPVPDKLVRELLEAARLAPSGVNLQPWRFVVVKSSESRAKLAKATPLSFVSKAPVVIVCCVDTQILTKNAIMDRATELKESGAFVGTDLEGFEPENYADKKQKMEQHAAMAYMSLNTAIAIDHITLRAEDLGLGSCWVMMFSQGKVKQAIELEDRYHVVALLPIGYPDQHPNQRPRLSLEEIIIKEV
ncbi:nitroreductase [Desulfitispora alkaliphila]|uniref:nitroreductase family protein n=1 Tax=Desulfitispora alkaliphila TaxID=622674 RepID=UPI003D1C341A